MTGSCIFSMVVGPYCEINIVEKPITQGDRHQSTETVSLDHKDVVLHLQLGAEKLGIDCVYEFVHNPSRTLIGKLQMQHDIFPIARRLCSLPLRIPLMLYPHAQKSWIVSCNTDNLILLWRKSSYISRYTMKLFHTFWNILWPDLICCKPTVQYRLTVFSKKNQNLKFCLQHTWKFQKKTM
jgi:hypothetical protein